MPNWVWQTFGWSTEKEHGWRKLLLDYTNIVIWFYLSFHSELFIFSWKAKCQQAARCCWLQVWEILPQIIRYSHAYTDTDSAIRMYTHMIACTHTRFAQSRTSVTVLTSVFLNLALRLFMFSLVHAVTHSITQSRLQRKETQMLKLGLSDVCFHFRCDLVSLKRLSYLTKSVLQCCVHTSYSKYEVWFCNAFTLAIVCSTALVNQHFPHEN